MLLDMANQGRKEFINILKLTTMKMTETIQDNKELFTSGEWRREINPDSEYSTLIVGGDDKNYPEPIARAFQNVYINAEQAEANAALIAEAPAMYRLLEKISEWIGFGHDEECCQMQEEISTVLNKANPKQ